jgi:hypothetical protein
MRVKSLCRGVLQYAFAGDEGKKQKIKWRIGND